MRLLVISQYFWPENFRVNELVTELVKRGHEVTVLTGYPNYPEGVIFLEFKAHPENFSLFAGAQVLRVPMAPRGKGAIRLMLNYLSFAVSAAICGSWKLRGQQFDAIFSFEPSPITAVLPAVLLRRLKMSPLLLWVLDLWPETLSAVGVVRSQRVLRLVGHMVSFIYRRCDRILVQSRGFAHSVEKYAGSAGDRIRYFPGWTEGLFSGALDAVKPAPELEPYADGFNILFAGNIGEAQDFPAIIDAAERLKHRQDIRWLVVGDGRAAGYVCDEVAKRGLQNRLIMLGRFPLERMPSFFSGADALLVSLKSDPIFSLTIPGKVQSYLGVGIPLLGMLDGEGRKVIEESEGGLVTCAGDGAGLAENVLRLSELTADQRRAMGERGRAYGKREFDRDVLIDALELHFHDALLDNSL
ncbi:glycosyltransferase family 4 protein [Paracidovorax wautersii]|uniref:Glycosyltransferase involved in cell wall bisynthesis n=1 Tax=Paracidovorax wautersii TaxID=1177982 RepID=A0A1I2CJ85_9BURK|nr:glycosyltransferase family 4 protein [Paracidovorax wautersii]SFE68459.1 Glycosyltransferase involved in cell wall bisynthesis [Paracidovorax wautersii]